MDASEPERGVEMRDDVPEADRLEQDEPVLDQSGGPTPGARRDNEAPEPDRLEQERPVAATVDDHLPGSDEERLVELSEEWEPR